MYRVGFEKVSLYGKFKEYSHIKAVNFKTLGVY